MLREKKAKIAIYVWYIAIAATSLFPVDGMGLYQGCTLIDRLSYPFLHQNVFHALCNIFVFNQCYRFMPQCWNLAVFYIFAISYPFASDMPIVGMSGVVYAYMGYIAPNVERKAIYNLTIATYIAIGFVFPNMAVGNHIYCYILGLLWGYLNAPLCRDK